GAGFARAALALVARLSGVTAKPPPRRARPRAAKRRARHVRASQALPAAHVVPLWKAAGIAGGAVAGFVLLGLVAVLYRRRRRPEYPFEVLAHPVPDPNDPYRYRGRF